MTWYPKGFLSFFPILFHRFKQHKHKFYHYGRNCSFYPAGVSGGRAQMAEGTADAPHHRM